MTDVVAIVSGGMDSATLVHHYLRRGRTVLVVSFDYGQRHAKELEYAAWLATAKGLQHRIVRMDFMAELLHGSALTSEEVAVPDGHYAEDSMRITVVPNRNAIMLAIAAGIAVAEGASQVGTGVHAGDHYIYPDCRPAFISAISEAFRAGTEGFGDVTVDAPFLEMTKADIARYGHQLDVDYERTWSCYKGGEVHCGTCGTCVERAEAFVLAKVADPTVYAVKPR